MCSRQFVRGLHGSWSRPANSVFEIDVGGLNPRAVVDFARPSLGSSTDLAWRRSEPFAAMAALTDSEAARRWQTWLTIGRPRMEERTVHPTAPHG
jgi:hypothetical protein